MESSFGSGAHRSLKDLQPLAIGGQADIYLWDEEKILRIFRRKEDEYLVPYEVTALNAVRAYGIPAPRVFGEVTMEGRSGLVMERIAGQSMSDAIFHQLWTLPARSRELGRLHVRLGSVKVSGEIQETKPRSTYCIEHSAYLNPAEKTYALGLLESLPGSDSLCHGDFHPGNILIHPKGNYIIDWSGANRGPIVSDIAHSYLLMKNSPRLDHYSDWLYRLIIIAGTVMAREYLRACHDAQPFDWVQFSHWTVVKAAERTHYGFPSERDRLIRYIDYAMKQSEKNAPADRWYLSL